MKIRSLVLGCSILALSLTRCVAAGTPPDKSSSGESEYVKAVELFHAKQFAETLVAADNILSLSSCSNWHFKAVFVLAVTYVEMK